MNFRFHSVALAIALFIILFVAAPTPTQAAINRELPFSSQLKSKSTNSIVPDGNYQVTFSIYTTSTGGTAAWSETQSVAVSGGVINVTLGTVTPIPDTLTFNAGTYYLGIQVGVDSEFTPRLAIGSVPTALNAAAVNGATTGTGANNILQLDGSGNLAIAGTIGTTGAPAGSATSSLLQLGATISGGSLNGTQIGVNALQGFSGDLVNLEVNGISQFKVASNGTVTSGNILPITSGTYDLGSSSAHFANAYIDNLSVGTTDTSGTSGSSFTINSAATSDATSALNFYRGGSLTAAQLLWNSSTGKFNLNNGVVVTGSSTVTGSLTVAPSARTGTAGALFTLTTPADTALTASTESMSLNVNTSATRTFAAGALTTQRETLFQAPTYAFNGVSTITNAATVAIAGAPTAGTNASITNSYALWVQSGTTRFDGGVNINGANNGIAYQNGSGNLTTGSGLTFDGTSLTVPNNAHIYAGDGSNYLYMGSGPGVQLGTAGGRSITLDSLGAHIVSDLDMTTHKITAVVDPTSPQDAATKSYVDAATAQNLPVSIPLWTINGGSAAWTTVSGSWAAQANGAWSTGGRVYNSSNTSGDKITQGFAVATTGTYSIYVLYGHDTSSGKMQVQLNGSDVGPLTDLYSAAGTLNQWLVIPAGTLTANTDYTIAIYVNGKNASSSGYRIDLQQVILR